MTNPAEKQLAESFIAVNEAIDEARWDEASGLFAAFDQALRVHSSNLSPAALQGADSLQRELADKIAQARDEALSELRELRSRKVAGAAYVG